MTLLTVSVSFWCPVVTTRARLLPLGTVWLKVNDAAVTAGGAVTERSTMPALLPIPAPLGRSETACTV